MADMITVYWAMNTALVPLIVPTIAIYIVFDFMGSILFSK